MGNNQKIDSWKENNPEGYNRALGEETQEYLAVWDFAGDNYSKSLEDRRAIGEQLPDDPDVIASMKGELVESLSVERIDRLDAARTIRDNIALANDLIENGDNIKGYADSMTDGLFDSVRILENKHGLDANDLVDRYDMNLNEQTMDRISHEDAVSEVVTPIYAPSPSTPGLGM